MVHSADVGHGRDAGGAQLMARDGLEVEVAPMVGLADVGEGGMDLLAGLVAARPRAGTDGRAQLALAAQLAHSGDAGGDDARGQAAPPGVEHGHDLAPTHPGYRDRQAVGGEGAQGKVGLIGGLTVQARALSRLRRAGGDPPHLGAVDLVDEAQPRSVHLGAQGLAVAGDRARIVLGEPPQVEARVGTARVTTATGGEDRPGAGQVDREVGPEGVERLG